MKIALRICSIALLLCLLCVNALAGVVFSDVSNITYYASGSIKSFTVSYTWPDDEWGSVSNMRLVLQREHMAENELNSSGSYGAMFPSFDEACAYDSINHTFGIVAWNSPRSISSGSDTHTFTFAEGEIPLNTDASFYVYQWHYWGGHCYPDNFICAIRVKNGNVEWAPNKVLWGSGGTMNWGYGHTSSWEYDSSAFQTVPGENPPVPKLPQTGDSANLALWMGMMAMAVTGMIIIRKRSFN